ncbi:adaptor protein MecA [Allofustis seminis]|uniref:adaptor protein MecA n=1 Tax=Allofustis seminis TaxID=166939 RepID=UPI000373C9D8|nr:adaptor protein MecA [Allofustis seminis]
MEIEHINDDTIRVRLRKSDFDELGVSFVELMSDQQQIEAFFYHVLDEADLEDQFKDSESVSFQVMPVADGLDLLISKNPHLQEELAEELERIFPGALSAKSEHSPNDAPSDASKKIDENYAEVIAFDDFEDVVQVAYRLKENEGDYALFAMANQYYLVQLEEMESFISDEAYMNYAIMLEYGTKTNYTIDFMYEHAEIIINEAAIEKLLEYF